MNESPDLLINSMNKMEYSKPAIKVKQLTMRTYFMAGSTGASVSGFTWGAKYANSVVLEEDEDEEDE